MTGIPELVWSDYCGKCGFKKKHSFHRLTCPAFKVRFPKRFVSWWTNNHHEFVRVPLNFNEWRKALAEKLKDPKIWIEVEEVRKSLLEEST